MENRASVVPGTCEAWKTGIPWYRGRARHGKQGFRGPGGERGVENRVSVVPEASTRGFPWLELKR
jgi:hypothetical protein